MDVSLLDDDCGRPNTRVASTEETFLLQQQQQQRQPPQPLEPIPFSTLSTPDNSQDLLSVKEDQETMQGVSVSSDQVNFSLLQSDDRMGCVVEGQELLCSLNEGKVGPFDLVSGSFGFDREGEAFVGKMETVGLESQESLRGTSISSEKVSVSLPESDGCMDSVGEYKQELSSMCDEKVGLSDSVSGSFGFDGENNLSVGKSEALGFESQESLPNASVSSDKVKLSLSEPDGTDSVVDDQRVLSSLSDVNIVSDSVSGSFVLDREIEDFVGKLETSGFEVQERENAVVGFASGDDKCRLMMEKNMDSIQEVNPNRVLVDENKESLTAKESEPVISFESKKKELIAELEAGSFFDGLCKDTGTVGGLKQSDESVRSSLTFQVIDDTAVIEPVIASKLDCRRAKASACNGKKGESQDGELKKEKQSQRKAKDKVKGLETSERQKKVYQLGKVQNLQSRVGEPQNVDQKDVTGTNWKYSREQMEALRYVKGESQDGELKKEKQSQRKAKDKVKGLETSERQKKVYQLGKVQNLQSRVGEPQNVDQKDVTGTNWKYSREQMEALRYVNIVEQRNKWRNIYSELGDAVTKEYDDLAPSKHQNSIRQNSQNETHFSSKLLLPSILGDVSSEKVSNELIKVEENEVESTENSFEIVSEEDESDGDYSSIQKPAFYVGGEPDFDSGPPEDGLEYLRRVRWEASHIPKVTIAKRDKRRVKKEQSVYMPQIPEIAECPEQLLPSKEWENAFLHDFSELRMVMSRNEVPSAKITLENCINGSYKDDLSEFSEDDGILASENSVLKSSINDNVGDYPTLFAIQGMDSVARVSMLKKRINLVETMSNIPQNECLWLFALCAVVDTPLDADTCASLRSLLRKCSSLRAAKCELDDEAVMLNILATISGRFFGQAEC